MKDSWVFGLSFFASHLLFRLGIAWVWALFLLRGPCFILPCAHELAGVPTMSLHCSCYDITYPFILLLPLGLRVEALAMSISYILSSFGLYYLAFLLGQTIPSFGLPWPISLFRLPRSISFPGLPRSISFLRLPQPISFLFQFHRFLLNSLGFFGSITTSLPLIIFRLIGLYACCTKLLIHFLGFLNPFTSFSTSYYSHGFTAFILWASSTHLFLPDHLLFFASILTIIPVILAFWSLICYFLSPSFSYCWVSFAIGLFCQKWASTNIN